jgi:heat shock protein HslJ
MLYVSSSFVTQTGLHMMFRHFLIGFLALAPLVATPALAQQPRTQRPTTDEGFVPQPRPEKQFPLGASWTAVSVGGKPVAGERPSLVIDEQLRAKGFGGCNTFSATAYPLREQALAVGPVAVTRKACPAGAMATERAFLVALRGARKWDLVQGRLVLTGVAGEIQFERAL